MTTLTTSTQMTMMLTAAAIVLAVLLLAQGISATQELDEEEFDALTEESGEHKNEVKLNYR